MELCTDSSDPRTSALPVTRWVAFTAFLVGYNTCCLDKRVDAVVALSSFGAADDFDQFHHYSSRSVTPTGATAKEPSPTAARRLRSTS
jgi:hypothetical protein